MNAGLQTGRQIPDTTTPMNWGETLDGLLSSANQNIEKEDYSNVRTRIYGSVPAKKQRGIFMGDRDPAIENERLLSRKNAL